MVTKGSPYRTQADTVAPTQAQRRIAVLAFVRNTSFGESYLPELYLAYLQKEGYFAKGAFVHALDALIVYLDNVTPDWEEKYG